MSFILDALKKSENERQEQSSAEFSGVPTSSGNAGPTRWLWLLAALLVVNFAVLIVVLLRPDEAAVIVVAEPQPAIAESAAGSEDASFADQVADAIEKGPETATTSVSTAAASPAVAAPPQVVPQSRVRTATVPTIDQLRLDGTLQIDELHLDIHVYSDEPAERFVFINMDKHREDSRIDEGPVVREITPDGVILEYQGRVFLLPRE